ncbi:hypothetical protein F511_11427 [Dorcoceras hygrometricum]|uniref:Uncharacterized protein n=1 Tax=Dorcoceras hygrometricum TaxID=472368 RepID=A0A2Z7D4L8_9LAMI|nr:hypothetical protein F511_11427 [Dorcoceras hygrometricum]
MLHQWGKLQDMIAAATDNYRKIATHIPILACVKDGALKYLVHLKKDGFKESLVNISISYTHSASGFMWEELFSFTSLVIDARSYE